MSATKKITALIFGVVGFCFCSTQLFGSVVVTSGYISGFNVSNAFAAAAFDLIGSGFEVTGSFQGEETWGPGDCPVCLPGTLLPVGGGDGGSDMNGGTARIGSTFYPSILWFGDRGLGSFVSVSGPPILLNRGAGTYTGTFSFVGEMCGVLNFEDTSCTVSLPSMTGTGKVTVEVSSFVENGQLFLTTTEASYTFGPEPGSLLLLGSGVLGLAGTLRTRRRL